MSSSSSPISPSKEPSSPQPPQQQKTQQASKKAYAQQLQTLRAELDLTDYGLTPKGRPRRKLTRIQSKTRTIQRKLLEKIDAKETAILAEEEEYEELQDDENTHTQHVGVHVQTSRGEDSIRAQTQKGILIHDETNTIVQDSQEQQQQQQQRRRRRQRTRLRGKQVAFEDCVIQGSLIFGGDSSLLPTLRTRRKKKPQLPNTTTVTDASDDVNLMGTDTGTGTLSSSLCHGSVVTNGEPFYERGTDSTAAVTAALSSTLSTARAKNNRTAMNEKTSTNRFSWEEETEDFLSDPEGGYEDGQEFYDLEEDGHDFDVSYELDPMDMTHKSFENVDDCRMMMTEDENNAIQNMLDDDLVMRELLPQQSLGDATEDNIVESSHQGENLITKHAKSKSGSQPDSKASTTKNQNRLFSSRVKRKRSSKSSQKPTTPTIASQNQKTIEQLKGKNIGRFMYRLKNFKSYRIALRHGDALGAHARGLHKTAIDKLKEVATAAPVAPQVYSSLGLVYENILQEDMKHNLQSLEDEIQVPHSDLQETQSEGPAYKSLPSEIRRIHRQIDLAKKSYGSYHVAALLCKKDFTLWVRAGDMAIHLAELHSSCIARMTRMDLQNISHHDTITVNQQLQYYSREKKKWLEEARDNYHTADSTRPPGITVPAKLAHAQMHLGNLSEALTILTDLKNQAQATKVYKKKRKKRKNPSNHETGNQQLEEDEGGIKLLQRSELERSYTAWMLYADLMLRIGHECSKWNQGIYASDTNYTFRRWLKRYSRTFDWRERRLQALCLALEAAAGTNSSGDVVRWVKDRAVRIAQNGNVSRSSDARWFVDSYEPNEQLSSHVDELPDDSEVHSDLVNRNEFDDRSDESNVRQEKAESIGTNIPFFQQSSLLDHEPALSTEAQDTSSFENERRKLIAKNREELAIFDKVTMDMNLGNDCQEAVHRATERKILVESHKRSVLQLVGSFQILKLSNTTSLTSDSTENVPSPLPLSASCATVWNIAYQLMKLCLSLELYCGGKLVAESITKYVRERIRMRDIRLEKLRSFEQREIYIKSSLVSLDTQEYDEIRSESADESSDENEYFLSDDDDFNARSKDTVNSLLLSPNFQVLYGLCLIGTRSCTYLAERMLHSMEILGDSDQSGASQVLLDYDIPFDLSWANFRGAMIQPMQKAEMFAFVAACIYKMNIETEWADRLISVYESYVNKMEQIGYMDSVEKDPSEVKYAVQSKRQNYLTVLFALLRMKVIQTQELISVLSTDRCNKAWSLLQPMIQLVRRHEDVMLRLPGKDATLGTTSVQSLKVLSDVISILITCLGFLFNEGLDVCKQTYLPYLNDQILWIIAWITGVPTITLSTTSSADESLDDEFPLNDQWQSDMHRALSKRAFNLCVSCSVSSFSGWENSIFNLNLLKRCTRPYFFGVSLKGSVLTGIISDDIVHEISRQWESVSKISKYSLDFLSDLSEIKKTEWYSSAIEKLNTAKLRLSHIEYGEHYALSIILSFSAWCLLLAQLENRENRSDQYLKCALSVLLPLSQFSLSRKLWKSDIGVIAADENVYEWGQYLEGQTLFPHEGIFDQEPDVPKPPRLRPVLKLQPVKPNDSRHFFTNLSLDEKYEDPLFCLVKVPLATLHNIWMKSRADKESDQGSSVSQQNRESGIMAMDSVDNAIIKLQQCTTEVTLQKACVQVAAALLDIVSANACYNPFVCLHHAAIFASQGSKGGNNDDYFKYPLPPKSQCTPQDALEILGRADCLRAIHFIDEAMFLCSYVAQVVCLHRDHMNTKYEWNQVWLVVGVYMYTCSSAIDASIKSLMPSDARKKTLEAWPTEVREEIGRALADAIVLSRITSKPLFLPPLPSSALMCKPERYSNNTLKEQQIDKVNDSIDEINFIGDDVNQLQLCELVDEEVGLFEGIERIEV